MNFEQYLQNKGLSEGVIKRYRAEMRRHRQFLHLLGKSPECATKKDLLDYLQSEKQPISRYQVVRKRPLSNRTKQSILSVLNHYYGYLMQQGLIAQNLAQFIRIRGVKKQELQCLFTDEELEQLIDDPDRFHPF